MAYPTIKLGDRHIIVVSGFKAPTDAPGRAGDPVITDEATLKGKRCTTPTFHDGAGPMILAGHGTGSF